MESCKALAAITIAESSLELRGQAGTAGILTSRPSSEGQAGVLSQAEQRRRLCVATKCLLLRQETFRAQQGMGHSQWIQSRPPGPASAETSIMLTSSRAPQPLRRSVECQETGP